MSIACTVTALSWAVTGDTCIAHRGAACYKARTPNIKSYRILNRRLSPIIVSSVDQSLPRTTAMRPTRYHTDSDIKRHPLSAVSVAASRLRGHHYDLASTSKSLLSSTTVCTRITHRKNNTMIMQWHLDISMQDFVDTYSE